MVRGNFCCIIGCKSSSMEAKESGEGLRFFSFPPSSSVRKKWLVYCRKSNRLNPDNARVCGKHFKPEDFDDWLKSQMLGYLARKLKKTAVPSLNLSDPDAYEPLRTPRRKNHIVNNTAEIAATSDNFKTNKNKKKVVLMKSKDIDELVSIGSQLKEFFNDESQIFGNFIAQELRNIQDQKIRCGLRMQLQQTILNYSEAEEASESSAKQNTYNIKEGTCYLTPIYNGETTN